MNNIFEERANNLAHYKDFHLLAEALGEYASRGISCRSPVLQEMAVNALKQKLTDHLLTDYCGHVYSPGSYYIRIGGKALIPFVYSRLMDLGRYGCFDLGHVLKLAEQMQFEYETTDTANIKRDSIISIMRWMDLEYGYTTSILRSEPIFLIMDQAPIREPEFFLREGCEVNAGAFIFWKTREKTFLAAPHETAFLLRLSDQIVRETWLSEPLYLSVVKEELRNLSYGHIGEMPPEQARKLVADLVCIGIAIESPFRNYIPFLGQSAGYLKNTCILADKLMKIVKDKRGF